MPLHRATALVSHSFGQTTASIHQHRFEDWHAISVSLVRPLKCPLWTEILQ